MVDPTLECLRLCTGWGDTQVLSDISFSPPPGEMPAVAYVIINPQADRSKGACQLTLPRAVA